MKKKPEDMAVDWKAETKMERLHSCRVYLLLHGMLSEMENVVVKRRLVKYAVKLGKAHVESTKA